jgi:ribosome-binding factor A
MNNRRVLRLNSLLKEVLSEVILRDVKHPKMTSLVAVTNVDISPDLQHAKVMISVIGSPKEKEDTMEALQSAAGYIAATASKKVVMRYFPSLTFKLDTSVEKQEKIDTILRKIHDEKNSRKDTPSDEEL